MKCAQCESLKEEYKKRKLENILSGRFNNRFFSKEALHNAAGRFFMEALRENAILLSQEIDNNNKITINPKFKAQYIVDLMKSNELNLAELHLLEFHSAEINHHTHSQEDRVPFEESI